MENKYILISLEDEKSKHLAEVLANKTCKKIINLLADKNELSEKDISDNLNIPLNTVEYNLKKLQKSEIVKKTKNFFWSKKGKKIPTYSLSNKSIIISPNSKRLNSKMKSVLPVFLVSGFLAILIKQLSIFKNKFLESSAAYSKSLISQDIARTMSSKSNLLFINNSPQWIWFLFGALVAIIIFALINWRKL